MTTDVRPGDELDWTALEAHLRAHLDLPAATMEVTQFTGGRANLTYLVSFGRAKLVVRRPPHGTIAPGAHDMAREARVLERLNDAFPRAPRALHFCADPAIVGAPFVVIEYRDGIVIHDQLPAVIAVHDDAARRVDLALIDAAADLHLVNPAEVGLGDLGQADGFADRQVQGWANRWSRVAPTAIDANTSAAMTGVAQRLQATIPLPQRSSIVHNDLKLDNCQFQPTDPDTVTSIFDWDMATLGDPLFDIAVMLTSMRRMPAWVLSDEDAAEHYAVRSGLDLSGIHWYLGFATWRTGVVLQQLHARYAAGDSADERLAEFGGLVPELAARAAETLDG